MSTEHILIRRYQDSDLDQLINLVRELQSHEVRLFERMKQAGDIGAWYVEDLQRRCREHSGEILLIDCGGELAGYAAVLGTITQDDPDETAYVYAMVADIAVTERYRGRGLGKRLLSECERHARDAGARWLRISVLAGNTRALQLYRHHGFADHLVELEKPLS